ncbi:hypothetical protein RHGRI_026899 [Rhododendron griersonianum]|nr:hypothetical protein RHGRI_026899 [Rhododendron griersonianum]
MAFGASLQSNLSDHESLDDSENEGSDEEFSFDELKQSYNMLFKESVKINESNLKMAENYNNSKKELVTAKKQVEELQVFLSNVTSEKEKLSKEVERLQEKNRVLIELNTASDDKINMLNAEIGNANILFERLNTGSKTLDDILSIQRPASDKTGLGFCEVSPTKTLGGKANELQTEKVTSKFRTINIANNVLEKDCDIKKSNFAKFIPTCHYCQVRGHIRPNCFQLHGYPNATHNHASLNKSVPKHHIAHKSLVNHANCDNDRNMIVRSPIPTFRPNNQIKTFQVRTRSIWVKKCDLHCFVAHTAFKARNSHMWNLNSDYSHYMPNDKFGRVCLVD